MTLQKKQPVQRVQLATCGTSLCYSIPSTNPSLTLAIAPTVWYGKTRILYVWPPNVKEIADMFSCLDTRQNVGV